MTEELTEMEYLKEYREMSLSLLNPYMVILINEHIVGKTDKNIPQEYIV